MALFSIYDARLLGDSRRTATSGRLFGKEVDCVPLSSPPGNALCVTFGVGGNGGLEDTGVSGLLSSRDVGLIETELLCFLVRDGRCWEVSG
jgi:hypothetical protein